jgi:CDP-2,3-bis-(O-geranylgeranyl)-sn-glycerol synthase
MGWIQPANILEVVILLMLANGVPVIAKKLLDNRFSYPLDAHFRFVDGNRLFGPSKTIRGIVLAVLATAAGATVMGSTGCSVLSWAAPRCLGTCFRALSSVG